MRVSQAYWLLEGLDHLPHEQEPVSHLSHAHQTALLAREAGAPAFAQVGALLHDAGKVFANDEHHALLGAALLMPHVPRKLYYALANHDEDLAYYEWRGYAETERCAEGLPLWDIRWDAWGKNPAFPPVTLGEVWMWWEPVLLEVLDKDEK